MADMVHSRWGASGFSRVVACHAVIRMARDCRDKSNPAAELGTAGHELGEFCLLHGCDAFDCLGFTFNNHLVDAAMADAVQLYVSFIRNVALQNNVEPMIETRVTMSSISDKMFGTSDCIFIVGDTLHVYDYKHGYIVVDVHNCIQAIYYAIAAMDTFGLWGKVTKIVTGIIQPRADHIDGSIRIHEYTIPELKSWQAIFAETFRLSNDPNSELNAGPHCTYCLASGSCRKRIERTLSLAFGDKPVETLNSEEIKIIFDEIPAMKRNIEKVEEQALNLARSGVTIEGYKLVKAIKRAKCEDEKGLVEAAKKEGVKEEDLYQRKLQSMTAVKKLMNYRIVDKFFIKPETGTQLVPLNASRPAVSSHPSATGRFNSVVDTPSATGRFLPITQEKK